MTQIINRAEAKRLGLTRFFTGKPCIKGHVAPRQTSNFRCVKCGFVKSRQYEKLHPEKKNAANRYQHQKLKLDVLHKLGGKCVCCKEKKPIFLCVDHINGGGRKHRQTVGSDVILRWLRRQIKAGKLIELKRDFRILCWNCNSAIHFLGYCPHKRKPK